MQEPWNPFGFYFEFMASAVPPGRLCDLALSGPRLSYLQQAEISKSSPSSCHSVCWPFRASVSMLSIMWGSQAKDLQQAVSTQTGCPCGPGPLEKQRRSNSRQREGLLQGPPAEMPMELGGQLNRLIKTRVRKLMKGEWEMKLMRWWEYLLGKLDFTLRLVYTHWSRRGSCAKSHLVFWSFPTWPTALQEFFSFEYFLVQLMSFSPTDV